MTIPTTLYALLLMLEMVPLKHQLSGPWADATEADAAQRYLEIAQTIGDVCSTAPSPRDCAALLVAVGAGESAFARDADVGPCHRLGGYKTRCDSGAAASVWQVQRWDMAIPIEALFSDRRMAATRALYVARSSLRMCRGLEPIDRLSGLSGRCQAGPGPWRARWQAYERARAWSLQ